MQHVAGEHFPRLPITFKILDGHRCSSQSRSHQDSGLAHWDPHKHGIGRRRDELTKPLFSLPNPAGEMRSQNHKSLSLSWHFHLSIFSFPSPYPATSSLLSSDPYQSQKTRALNLHSSFFILFFFCSNQIQPQTSSNLNPSFYSNFESKGGRSFWWAMAETLQPPRESKAWKGIFAVGGIMSTLVIYGVLQALILTSSSLSNQQILDLKIATSIYWR